MQTPQSVYKFLKENGLNGFETVHYNLPPATLYEHAISNHESVVTAHGPLNSITAPRTGRSPNDRFIVDEPSTSSEIAWGDVNVPISEDAFEHLLEKMRGYVHGKTLYVRDVFAGADPRYRMPVRFITEKAWHNLFLHNMFIRPKREDLYGFEPRFTLIDFCELKSVPEIDKTNSDAWVIVNFDKHIVIIGGTHYAGEMKKSIFGAMNFYLPRKGVLTMHCSANISPQGDSALFFGLSGTGKTTLSADQSRTLIGDDEHGWSNDGIFNLEGGCYAKLINLSEEGEPEIYGTTRRFGTVVENVVLDPETREIQFDDASITQNTRCAYPIHFIPNASEDGRGGHPKNIVLLTADAFGVMPPISRLTPEQTMYHFLSGYTAKVAGTEAGVEGAQATFSSCFGEPFMVLPPSVYAEMLGERIKKHGSRCWLVNTGWTGGAYGVGSRMKLKYTRAMLNAALDGRLDDVETFTDPIFGLHIPKEVPGVPSEVLDPKSTWDDPDAYDAQAQKLADMFAENFEKYADDVTPEILAAGPTLRTTV